MSKAIGLGPKATRPGYSQGQGYLADQSDSTPKPNPGAMKGQSSGKGSGTATMNDGAKISTESIENVPGSAHATAIGQKAGKGTVAAPFGSTDTKPK